MRLMRPIRKPLIAVVALVAALLLAGCNPLVSMDYHAHNDPVGSQEAGLINSINAYRHARGLGSLTVNRDLEAKARLWAIAMAGGRCGSSGGVAKICHSQLTDGITARWGWLGENVALVGRNDIGGAQNAFAHSAPHAANMAAPQAR